MPPNPLTAIHQRIRTYRAYRSLLQELQSMDRSELDDFNLSAARLRTIARNGASGNAI